ncbi:MAG: pitrilysin family protein [Clostridia bacterium]
MEAQIKQFESGLRLVFYKYDNIYSVSMGILVKSGSRYEDETNNGYSHFIEHLLFKGTSRRSATQISNEIDSLGGTINAFTSKDTTCFYTKTGKDNLVDSFDLLADIFLNSTFAEKELNLEKRVIKEEISVDKDTPDEVCHDMLAQNLFGKTSLGQTILGTPKNINQATRESLQAFMRLRYTPNNIVISVAGNTTFEEAIELTQKYFESQLNKRNTNTIEVLPEFKSDFSHAFKDTEQSHIALAYPSFSYNDSLFPATVLLAIAFGGGVSSRLFQAIREKNGLAYSVYAYNSAYSDCGYLELYCGTNPNKLSKVVDILHKQIDILVAKGITEQEFLRSKSQILGSIKLSQENTMSVMRSNGSQLLRTDKIKGIEEQLAEIERVTIKDIANATQKIFSCVPASVYVGVKAPNYNLIKVKK